MNCPMCNTENLIIEEKEFITHEFSSTIYYASYEALLDDDPNWGGGYYCEFFIVRESKELILKELKIKETN